MSFGKDPMIERKGNNSDNAPGVEEEPSPS